MRNWFGKVNLKFWQESCPVECLQHVKKLVVHGLQGKKHEHAFIKFIGERAQVLEKTVSMICFETAATVKWASKVIKHIHFKLPTPALHPFVLLGVSARQLSFMYGPL